MFFLKTNKYLFYFIFLTLFSLPLYLIRCKSFAFCASPIPFTLLEILILITFFYWLIIKFIKKRNLRRIISEIRAKIPLILQVIILIFVVSPGINIIFSQDKLAALGFYKAYFVEPILFFIVVFDYLSEKNNLKSIFWAFLSSSLWISLVAIIEKITNYSPFNPDEFASRGRVGAIFQTSNWVGLLVGPTVVVLIAYFFYLRKEKTEAVFLGFKETTWVVASLIITFGGLMASGSRGAWFGVLASCLFFFGFILFKKIQEKSLQNTLKKIFIASILIFFALIIVFLFNINSVIKATNKLPIYSQISPRLCLWQAATNIIKEKPLVGSGLGGFVFENNTHHTCSQETTSYPHNLVLNFWLETGIFGLISFIALCSWIFFNLLAAEKINYLKVGLAASLVSLLFHGLVDVPYLKNDLSVAFWTMVALSMYLINLDSLFKVVVRRVSVPYRR